VLGSVTGLNPVWVFISILAGARIGGLLGVVMAVPTAVVIKSALFVLRAPQGSPIQTPLVEFDLIPDELDLIPGGEPPKELAGGQSIVPDEA
jgi:hypothetical protein